MRADGPAAVRSRRAISPHILREHFPGNREHFPGNREHFPGNIFHSCDMHLPEFSTFRSAVQMASISSLGGRRGAADGVDGTF